MESPGHRFVDSWVCLLQLAKGSNPLVSNPGRNPQVEVTKVDTNTNMQALNPWICLVRIVCFSMFLQGFQGIHGHMAYGCRRAFPSVSRTTKEKRRKIILQNGDVMAPVASPVPRRCGRPRTCWKCVYQ